MIPYMLYRSINVLFMNLKFSCGICITSMRISCSYLKIARMGPFFKENKKLAGENGHVSRLETHPFRAHKLWTGPFSLAKTLILTHCQKN